jgi:hypothetical protein
MVRAFGLVADRDESDVALQQRHSDGERKRSTSRRGRIRIRALGA